MTYDEDPGTEAEALEDQSDGGAGEFCDRMDRDRWDSRALEMLGRYTQAKNAEVGATIQCPACGRSIVKTTYHKTFCGKSNKKKKRGKSSCKDFYHNTVECKFRPDYMRGRR